MGTGRDRGESICWGESMCHQFCGSWKVKITDLKSYLRKTYCCKNYLSKTTKNTFPIKVTQEKRTLKHCQQIYVIVKNKHTVAASTALNVSFCTSFHIIASFIYCKFN